MFRAALFTALFTAALAAQCRPTIRQTTTFNDGVFCATFTYCYEVCNPVPCVLPIRKVCVKFNLGTDLLDAGSIQSPPGWSGAVDPATNEVCWFADLNAGSVHSNECRSFCVTTVCNPRGVEGIQTADFSADRGLSIARGVRTSFALAATHRNFLAGEMQAGIGQVHQLQAASALEPFGQNLVLASPFALPFAWHIQDLGLLRLDPVLILVVGVVPLDANGVGVMRLPIPHDPGLLGGRLQFQSLALSPTTPRLSNLTSLSIH
ncbi:MAG: hypothetical protein IT457_02455 [Planctomycetes bacterium]|nr:hypothetical protein [Planctomycetota bacterium]